jgi:hypothetical protein
LLLVATPVIADAEEVTFEATMTLEREVADETPHLAGGALTTAT